MPRAGDYRHRIAILTAVATTDSICAIQSQWVPTGYLWSSLAHDFRPNDTFSRESHAMHYEDNTWFTTRKTNRVTRAHRLRHGNTDYTILTIHDETGENKETKILVREVAIP